MDAALTFAFPKCTIYAFVRILWTATYLIGLQWSSRWDKQPGSWHQRVSMGEGSEGSRLAHLPEDIVIKWRPSRSWIMTGERQNHFVPVAYASCNSGSSET